MRMEMTSEDDNNIDDEKDDKYNENEVNNNDDEDGNKPQRASADRPSNQRWPRVSALPIMRGS